MTYSDYDRELRENAAREVQIQALLDSYDRWVTADPIYREEPEEDDRKWDDE